MGDSLADEIVDKVLPFFLMFMMLFVVFIIIMGAVGFVVPKEKLDINDYLIEKQVIEDHNILIISNKYDIGDFNVIDLGEVNAEAK